MSGVGEKLGKWWEAVLAWDPHWTVQTIIGALLVFVLASMTRWLWSRTIDTAKWGAAKLQHQALERKEKVYFEYLLIKYLEGGRNYATASVTHYGVQSIMGFLTAIALGLLLALRQQHMSPVAQIILGALAGYGVLISAYSGMEMSRFMRALGIDRGFSIDALRWDEDKVAEFGRELSSIAKAVEKLEHPGDLEESPQKE